MRMKNWQTSIKLGKAFGFAFLLAFCLSACNKSNTPISNLEMGNILDNKGKASQLSGQVPYYTDFMLKKFEREYDARPEQMRYNSALDYGLMLLLNGQNQKAINVLIEFLNLGKEQKEVTPQTEQHYKVLALAYLREAEYQNCIYNHNGESCIIPLEGKGIHALADPARLAKDCYKVLLDYNPKDYQSIWFYNISSMAAGDYPDKMEERFVIAPDKFYGEVDFPKFPNVALESGVASMDHAGGSIIEDFNNDGLLDIFTTSYGLSDQTHYYQNTGGGAFDDKSAESGVDVLKAGLNCIQGDFNNDGWTDVFIMRGAWLGENGQLPNSLLINRSGQFFEDISTKANLFNEKPSGAVAVADINRDGLLDIFVGNESGSVRLSSDLFLNKGDESFKQIAKPAGLEVFSFVKSANFADVNNDGWPDLFVSVYHGKNKLYIHQGLKEGIPQFVEMANEFGVQEPIYSFSSWFWDYNHDGWDDLLVFSYDNSNPFNISAEICKEYLEGAPAKNKPVLYLNQGGTGFEQATFTGLDESLYTMGGNYGDLNNDGYFDFYSGTGEFNLWATIPNKMYVHNASDGFIDVTHAGGFGMIQKGHGVSFGDLDNDGDQDIYHQVGGAVESDVFHNMLLKNPGFEANNWITLKLQGSDANRSAIGSRLKFEVKMPDGSRRVYYNKVHSGGSFGANTLRVEMGLGLAVQLEKLTVNWADANNSVTTYEDLKLNQFYLIDQEKSPELLPVRRVALGNEPIAECINF
jgi:hypothetical protein